MSKKNYKTKPRNKLTVFVPMSADFLHHGHINILVKSNKFGNIVVGLMTNAGIKSYKKRLPFFDYNQRKDKPDRHDRG